MMKQSKLTHGSLFSGIGAPELASEWMGWENVFHCEINDFCRSFLDKRFKSTSYADITKTDFNLWRNRVDVLTGCFPCIMSRKGEIRVLSKDKIMTDRLIQLEKEVDSLGQKNHAGFFPKGYIPERFCREYGDGCPTVQEVIDYVNRDDAMIDMFEPEGGYSCMSLYHGLCE